MHSKSPNSDVRYQARKALLQFDPKDSIKALAKVYTHKNPRVRARVLWLLAELENKDKPTLKKALKDPNPDIRVTAIRIARQHAPKLVELLSTLVNDPSARVRSEVAVALHNLDEVHVPTIWAQLARNLDVEDRWNLEALGIAADGRWDSCLDAWFEAGGDWKSDLGRKLIWRSRAKQTSGLLAKCLNLEGLTEDEVRKLIRNFDFQPQGPEKEEALRQLAYHAWRKETVFGWLVSSEAFQRLKNSTYSNTTQFRQQLNTYLEHAPFNRSFLKLVSRYNVTTHFETIFDAAINNPNQTLQLASIQALLNANQQPLISDLVKSATAEGRETLVALLADAYDERAFPILKEVMVNRNYPWELRKQATLGIGSINAGAPVLVEMGRNGIFPEDLKEVAGTVLVQTTHVRAFEEAPRYFPIPQLKGEVNIPGMTDLVVMQGNKEAGKQVFQEATCATCHEVNGEGINFGPDLSAIGAKFAKIGIYEAILNPNAAVSESYQTTTVKLKDGTASIGLLNNETQEEIALQLPGGVQRTYSKSTVASIEKSTQSLMPSGLQRLMTVNDLADLVEYLSSLQ